MNTVEAEVIEPSNAIALRDPNAPAQEQKQAMTPAQAKIDAVASLTMKAYDRASMLTLSEQEIQALQADFPDDAFLPGAAGKEHLLYIQHACLRDRLNQVFRPGQWSIVPRNRWAEPFKTQKGNEASRVYVEAMLIIRGCFVAEAIGEMEYYPNNATQNYGDAVEGAKTAALRRCCKEFGIGLQAWRKDWCDGWWTRKRTPSKPVFKEKTTQHATQPIKVPEKAIGERKEATPEQRQRMIAEIEAQGEAYFQQALQYFIAVGAILPNEGLNSIPLYWVPTIAREWRDLGLLIAKDPPQRPAWIVERTTAAFNTPAAAFNPDEPEENPFEEHEKAKIDKAQANLELLAKNTAEQPDLRHRAPQEALPMDDEKWRSFVVPFGKSAGTTLDKLPKNKLYGFWANFTVETEYNGKAKKPETIAKDRAFRAALDMSGVHYGFTKED